MVAHSQGTLSGGEGTILLNSSYYKNKLLIEVNCSETSLSVSGAESLNINFDFV
jgi:hypothetical protein